MAATSTSTSLSLKEYLKRYESGADDPKKQKKKKKKKEKPKSNAMGGIVVVDEDPVWQKPVQIEEEIESADEEKPQIDEDIEVKRMRRLEAIRARKAYHSISEDGSGWVPVSDPANPPLDSGDRDRDMSPPRKGRARFDTPSPEREGKMAAGDSDISPPRQRRRRVDTPSPSPTHRRRADTPSPSPTRRRTRADTPSPSPKQRRRRADTSAPSPKRATEVSDNDLGNASPPRRERQPIEDISPPRRRRQIQTPGANISPPRSRKGVTDVLSPPRRRAEEATDVSPPRRRRNGSSNDISAPSHSRRGSTKGLSPPRHHADKPADLSPPRRSMKVSSREISPPPRSGSADLSPPRRSGKGSTADFSPPRRGRPCSPHSVKLRESPSADLSPPRKKRNEAPLTKQRAGLFSGKDFGEEIKQKKKEEASRLASMDPLKIGKGAEPVFRDKQGKVISKEEISKSKEEEKPKEKKLEWGKGLAQKREAEAVAEELEHERHKPFARTRDDPELDKMFKERLRWGDPMAHLVKRKQSELILEDLGDDEKMKESGFIIPQTVPSHSWLKRGIDFPPNRYGIRPGRHWDGVDRSNGYEKELFKRQNEKRATEQEAYLWSVSDM